MTELTKDGTARFEPMVANKLAHAQIKLKATMETAQGRQYDIVEEWCDELIDDLQDVRRLCQALGNLNEEDA